MIVGTIDQYNHAFPHAPLNLSFSGDGFSLRTQGNGKVVRIVGHNERGALYGAFEYLSRLAQGTLSSNVDYTTSPSAPIRWTNEWDNMDGSIERGYAGNSIFFENGAVLANLSRVTQYARLLASIRVNAVVVNNVNADPATLESNNINGLGRIADAFRPYGIQLGLSPYFASPVNISGLPTYDPLDSRVIAFWQNKTDEIYKRIPDMAGYLVKASSEGQPGPLDYNRTLAQAANLFAKAVKPYGGLVMYRGFIYDATYDKADWTADRAKGAVDYFNGLDGKFDDNVVVQIKYGPVDFQVREPASPLFSHLPSTSMALEVEVSQEYLGQQCHLAYLPPLWKTVTDFDLRINGTSSRVRDIITNKRFKHPSRLGGSAAVVNVGQNSTWLGSHLAMSNLYAYGRLAWNWESDETEILQDWVRLTFGRRDPHLMNTITQMSLASWPAYENYTGNLGTMTITDIYTHFGPNPQRRESKTSGTWLRADEKSIGMDRTVWNGTGPGTGFARQYPDEVYQMYEDLENTPDNLLLWFHHVPYTRRLHSGETVVQHFYNAHYSGAQTAADFVRMWQSLHGSADLDEERYQEVLFRQVFQAGHALVWRDAIVNWLHNVSGIPDDLGRVGHHPWRIEAESMLLDGYKPYAVDPFEAASNSTAIVTSTNTTVGRASVILPQRFTSGVYNLAVNFFDMLGGNSTYEVSVNNCTVATWTADWQDTGKLGHAPSIYIDAHSATRITFPGIKVRNGDRLSIVGTPSGIEPAPLDYISLLPVGVVD
ncbi:hypothetical protein PRZ48_003024 [Zasmidium cellare]|uniref:Alpha-glucuronidase n=1 Tax=Zasmidium cellare TaxID=395010 RepID=A0ABR0EV45_ZASCE|nr:hypothetical protein PRZ48_003024 [Zasmidium cellare]